MSIPEILPPDGDVTEYRQQIGEAVAAAYADNTSLRELHVTSPEVFPEPLVVRRWRVNVPAFDLLMREAEGARAEFLQEECITEADKDTRPAAAVANSIKARKDMIQALDPLRGAKRVFHGNDPTNPLSALTGVVVFTREQLLAIARGAVLDAGQVEEMDPQGEGGHPPLSGTARPSIGEERGLSTPLTISPEKPVTCDRESEKNSDENAAEGQEVKLTVVSNEDDVVESDDPAPNGPGF